MSATISYITPFFVFKPLNNGHTGGRIGVLSTAERLSLSQRLLMYNGHTEGRIGVLSTVERLSLSLRGC